MPQVSFKGSGVGTIDKSKIGFGQGLQVGLTNIDFAKGIVSFTDQTGNHDMGRFTGLAGQDSRSRVVRALVFKSNGKCTLTIDNVSFDYELLGEWITYSYLNISQMQISRDSSGQNPDVFDFQFIASDDPEYKFTIQRANRDSEQEVLFSEASRAVNTYVKTVNLRGAKKIILQGQSPASVETGVATVTLEVYDPAKDSWNELVPNIDIFTIAQNETKVVEIGDTVSKSPIAAQTGFADFSGTAGNPITAALHEPITANGSTAGSGTLGANAIGTYVGHVLPSGDNILRAKVVVATGALTFSLSITKVFE